MDALEKLGWEKSEVETDLIYSKKNKNGIIYKRIMINKTTHNLLILNTQFGVYSLFENELLALAEVIKRE